MSHLEILIVHLGREPGPLHLSCFSLVLVEIFEGFRLLGSHIDKLRIVVENILNFSRPMHLPGLTLRASPVEPPLVRKASLVASEFIDIKLFLELFVSV